MTKRYAIVDIETTGGKANRDKITEIAIVIHDGQQVIDSFESLINPQVNIPYGITELTGITNEMVANAPYFYEVAKTVVEKLEGCIFVAHNVRFDYGFIQEEFRRLGYTFTKRKLCTVQLSRKAFPGLSSYSLGRLIQHFNIKVNDRHRAMADVMATVQLFENILASEAGEDKAMDMVNLGIKAALLPPGWDMERMHTLPEGCGVYYMYNDEKQVVYVGKSTHIRQRIAEHFQTPSEKSNALHRQVSDITWEETGSELVALLLESHEIKTLSPPMNRAQKQKTFPFGVRQGVNALGYPVFEIVALKDKNKESLQDFATAIKAKGKLERLREAYQLCPKLMSLETGSGACFKYHIGECFGACVGLESSEVYQTRFDEALTFLEDPFDGENIIILDQGRTPEEISIIYIHEGKYQGFGYCTEEEIQTNIQSASDFVDNYQHNPETQKIIRQYIAKKPSTTRKVAGTYVIKMV